MPKSRLSKPQRARRYLQASVSAGYTGLPEEHREAYQAQMRAHERAYPGVRRHSLAGTMRDFDKPLSAGEREHQRHLREQEGLTESDLRNMRQEIRAQAASRRSELANAASTASTPAKTASGGVLAALDAGATGHGNILMQAIGMILLLSLVYLLIAGKGMNAVTGIVGVVTGGVRSFIAPVDPIASLEGALGAVPVSSSATPASPAATAASTSGASAANAQGYVEPFTGATAGRIDQGQDFTLPAGAPIRAIGPGKVVALQPNWFDGEPLLAYQLTGGPDKGKVIYDAEQISPTVRPGQVVKAGQVIARYAKTGTGLETGWATPSGETLARATTGYTEGQATQAGKSFSSFLAALGVPT